MSVIRIAFLGTSKFAKSCLQSLNDDDHFEIATVISQPDRPAGRKMKPRSSPVKDWALDHSLNVQTPKSVNQPEVIDGLLSQGVEACVVVAYGQIISEKFLAAFPDRVVNVHASLLPRWRGAAPIQRAIMNGDHETGVTLQKMVKKLDAGDIIGERRLTIDSDVNALELHDQLIPLAQDLLHVEFMDFLRGHLAPHPQDESKAVYAHKIKKSEGAIDWSHEAQTIHNQVRGLAWGPGAYTLRGSKKLKIHRTVVTTGKAKPGRVIEVESDSFTVACSKGALKVLEVQPESKARQSVSQYLKGYPMKGGETLGTQ